MHLAITGGSGRIGAATVSLLRSAGHRVLSLDLVEPKDRTPDFAVADNRDYDAMLAHFAGVDVVLHIGEIPGVYGYRPSDLFARNTAAGSAVMQAAADAGVKRLVYVSSCQVYGLWSQPHTTAKSPSLLPIVETYAKDPQNAYAASKVANEAFASELMNRTGMPITIARFPWVVPFEHARNLCEKYPTAKEINAEMATYLHMSDAATALAACAEATHVGLRAYHFAASDVSISSNVREAMRRRYPTSPLLPADWPEHQGPVSCDKAASELDWRAKWLVSDKCRNSSPGGA